MKNRNLTKHITSTWKEIVDTAGATISQDKRYTLKENHMKYPVYKLTLHKTYYDKGFFNLGVDVDNYIQADNGTVHILLGNSKKEIIGRLNRDANLNSTPRIYGGNELKHWIQNNFNLKDLVLVHILAPNTVWITDI